MCSHNKIIAQMIIDSWLSWMQLSHAAVGMFSSPAASRSSDTSRVWSFPVPCRAAGALLYWTLASSNLVASRLPRSGTCACWGVSDHVSWTFFETWWNLATYLATHVGSFIVASLYNKAEKFPRCCMEKSGPEICDS